MGGGHVEVHGFEIHTICHHGRKRVVIDIACYKDAAGL